MANKITWVNFLHIYQPPWQHKGVIDRVASESYEYLLTLFEKYPHFKATINITGNLIEQLEEYRPDLLKRFKTLIKSGQLEITATAKYHAFLPLIDKGEIKRQIELNQEILAQHFDLQNIKGFYMPEMAYSNEVAKIVKKMGFEFIILDQIHCKDDLEGDILYIDKKSKLQVVFRNRQISKAYPAEVIYNKLKDNEESQVIITATDGEIYGHFHEDWQGHIEKILQNKNLEVKSLSDYIRTLKIKKKIGLRSASWESTELELKNKIPYALWQDPKNKIHKSLWKLVAVATKLVNKYKEDKNWHWSRNHLDRGLSSCTFWWASAKRPSDFSPLTWNPDMIDNGSEELIRAVRSLEAATSKEKIKAEKIYIDIKKNTWLDHWKKYNR